ncbi:MULTISPECIES: DUF4430 domain-containing protein [Streptomyces]|uniref:Transcobalamin-like C-terminal domain-containing protein n=1 Tax=Streptomyces griseus subsp. griseus (strain JCM 4626 / CBS 651.72 / NBRC 13350 / KCC S-0626 / ISP 5235) TaxID=455632 RepID=B1VXL6_STRGG|nr:DUF4430 domain-containing protein [Streptomyces griseus]MBW3704125.1 DUF4430 domain-containing protein [Streptomyces griseus]BAG18482.1 hypothetical protein SGR_1653 [Streptomyces griseus subsp. griseus NBRC 13350]SED47959.1 protein of unknown function [Streptomyces griseus]SQA25744.1 Uncharacterised protein [Streptomyces griseus]
MGTTLLRRTALTTAALGLALTAAPAVAQAQTAAAFTNAPVRVTVTVQGPDGLLFQKKVFTWGHDVTTATGGTHKCDGTNGSAHATKVPTPTAALDHAAKRNGFTWDGTWYASFDDFSVDTVKGVSGGGSAYWSISVNGTPTPVGGCQFEIENGDQVAFTWTSF